MVDHRLTETNGLTHASAPTPEVLPDFCSGETLLRVLVVAILLAVIILLIRNGAADPLADLAPIALFAGWVALSSLLFICLLQHWLQRMSLAWQVLVPTVVPVINTALVHLAAEALFFAEPETRLRVIAIAGLLSLIAMHYLYVVAAWKEETQRVLAAREQALRARVRPHFLFNSMNSIAELCRSDPAKAEQITLDLADLFRSTFATGPSHTIRRELELVREYLNIEQTRFGDRLAIKWEVPESAALDVVLPALVLQPLVENAIQHGVAPSAAGGRIWVRVRDEGATVRIEIGNTVGGNSPPGTHTAGEEARARLRQCFGDKVRIAFGRRGDRFEVTIGLPKATKARCPAP